MTDIVLDIAEIRIIDGVQYVVTHEAVRAFGSADAAFARLPAYPKPPEPEADTPHVVEGKS
jgi:hypothetical protein